MINVNFASNKSSYVGPILVNEGFGVKDSGGSCLVKGILTFKDEPNVFT